MILGAQNPDARMQGVLKWFAVVALTHLCLEVTHSFKIPPIILLFF